MSMSEAVIGIWVAAMVQAGAAVIVALEVGRIRERVQKFGLMYNDWKGQELIQQVALHEHTNGKAPLVPDIRDLRASVVKES